MRGGGGVLQRCSRGKRTSSFFLALLSVAVMSVVVVVVVVFFVCLCATLGWRRCESLCSTAACLLLRQHWPPLAHNLAGTTHTHTYTYKGEMGEGVGAAIFPPFIGEKKKLISNINARPSALCAIVLLSFQKLVF